jgi:hypothetical protein
MPDLSFHARNRLLARLSPAEFSLLQPHLRFADLKPGTVLTDGQSIETATVGREGAVNTIPLPDDQLSFGRAVVQASGSALVIAASRLTAARKEIDSLKGIIDDYTSRLLAQVQQTAACNALHNIEERLARWLLQTRDRIESDEIALTQDFLSQMLGVHRPTVTLAAYTLQNAGLIRYGRGRIQIIDRAGLEGAACECYDVIRRLSGPDISDLVA